MNQIDQMPLRRWKSPQKIRAPWLMRNLGLKALPESFIDHQPGDERCQHGEAEQRDHVPAPAVAVVERNQPPSVQGTGELTKVEGGAFALDGAGVGVDVQGRLAAAGIADLGSKGEMLFVGALDGFDQEVRLGFVDRLQDLAEAERLGIFVGLAGPDVRVGQPDDLLADHRQGAGDADDQDEEPDGQGQPAVDEEPESGAGLFDMRLTVGSGVVGTDHGLRGLDAPRSSI